MLPARIAAALLGAAVFLGAPAAALELPDLAVFEDPVDGRLDASRWLLDRKGFLPVPILVTEPAVGYGAGLGLLFFHRNPESASRLEGADAVRRFEPPDITGGAAFGTENGSKGGGIGHLGFSEGRRWRYAAGAAYGSLNLAWYGLPGVGAGAQSNGLDFNIEAKMAVADVRRRLGETQWWAGLRYVGANTQSRFALRSPAEIPQRQFDATISGLGLVAEYDGRDNIFTPNSGLRAYLQAMKFDGALGSDHDFSRSRLGLNAYFPAGGIRWWSAFAPTRSRWTATCPSTRAPSSSFAAFPPCATRAIGRRCWRSRAAGTSTGAGRSWASPALAARPIRPQASAGRPRG